LPISVLVGAACAALGSALARFPTPLAVRLDNPKGGAVIFDPTLSNKSPLRRLAIGAIAVDVAMIAIRVASYRQLLAMPGSVAFIAKRVIVLVFYLGIAIWLTGHVSGNQAVALSVGTSLGLLTAIVQVTHLCIESFVTVEGSLTTITVLLFMLGTFLIWGVAGYDTGRRGASVSSAVMAGSWAARVCMLVLVGFGVALTFASVPSARYVSTWWEFRSSGWTDATAFGIANTFDSAYAHLLAGPIVGAVTGGIRGLIGELMPSSNRLPPTS
jgi:hypothetical protein